MSARILLEPIYDNRGVECGVIWTSLDDLNSVDDTGKKPIDQIKTDIANGSDTQGMAKYRKILEENGVISTLELQEWRGKHACLELNSMPKTI